MDWLIQVVADNVFGYILEQSGAGEKIRNKLIRGPLEAAFQRALQKAFRQLEQQHPHWAAAFFDLHFFEHQGAPILAQFLLRDGQPDPEALAHAWAASLDPTPFLTRAAHIEELLPIATHFIMTLDQALKAEPSLRDLQNDRAIEQTARNLTTVAQDISAIRTHMESHPDRQEILRRYLHWLIERNLYLDPRGTYQTQRQVQVKLEEVYVSLTAQRDEISTVADRYLFEQESAALETRLETSITSEEDAENEREMLLARFSTGISSKDVQASKVLELAETVLRYDHLTILGDPGSGKSTLLRYLALKHAQALWNGQREAENGLGPTHFPIFLRIADYAEHGMPQGKSLSEFLTDYCGRYECPRTGLADLFFQKLSEGSCLVLLDGLDEIVNTDDRLKVVQQIEAFVHQYESASNRIVVTSRIAGYRTTRLGRDFVHYSIREMDHQQIHRFLEAWCFAVEAAQTPDLSPEAQARIAQREISGIMHAIENAQGVRRLASNPLLLRILALIHRTGAQLPQKRIELYKLAADTLARTWRIAQGVSESALVDDSYLTRLLGKLAYWLHVERPTGIATEQEVYRELGQEWARIKGISWEEDNPDIHHEIEKFLRQVREHTGLFVERAPRRYGFMHLTFEEYYAARYLVARSRTRAELIRKHLHDPRWEEPILLAMGFVGLDSPDDATELVETAILAQGEEAEEQGFQPSRYEDLLGRDYLFALRCLGDQISVNARTMQYLLKRLTDEVLYESGLMRYQRYRQAVEERWVGLKGSKAAAQLCSQLALVLTDPRKIIRYRAAIRLAQLGETSTEVDTVLLQALYDTNQKVSIQAAKRLIVDGYTSKEFMTRLITLYCNMRASGKYSVFKDVQALLFQFEYISAEILHDLLHTQQKYRFHTVAALLHLVNEQKRMSLQQELARALQSKDSKIQHYAALAFRFLQPEARSPGLIAALHDALKEKNTYLRSLIVGSLWANGYTSRTAEAIIIKLLKSKNPHTQTSALTECYFLRYLNQQNMPRWLLPKVLYILNSNNRKIHDKAWSVLQNLPSTVLDRDSLLLQTVSNELFTNDFFVDGWIQPEACSSITINTLLHHISDENVHKRSKAAMYLKKLGIINNDIIAILSEALQTSAHIEIWKEAADLIGNVGQANDQILHALQVRLTYKPSEIRSVSGKALVQLGRRFPFIRAEIEQILLQALTDSATNQPVTNQVEDDQERYIYDTAFDSFWQLQMSALHDQK